MALAWTEDLSVGYGHIDLQHKELFSRYNDLLIACKEGKGREAIEPLLGFLFEYVTSHFAEEENLMFRHGYPEREEHMKQHRDLVIQIVAVQKKLQERGASVEVITAIDHTLLNWLLNHVKQVDVKLGRFLTANHQ